MNTNEIIITIIIFAVLLAFLVWNIILLTKNKKEKEENKKLKEILDEKARENIQLDAESRMLIRNISHDLKTPITSIKGYADGIIDGVASTPEKLNKYAHTIYSKACDMDALIDELKMYSQINTSRAVYEFAPLDAPAFFEKYAAENKDDLEQQGITIKFYSYLPSGTKVIADENQLKRVMNNIIGNSVKYMDKKEGFIGIRLKEENGEALVEVEDNGRGIGEEELPYIFDRFYRADESRTKPTNGSGIGLSIVKKIVEDHGGKIRATSRKDIGTVIHFTLKFPEESR